MSLDSKINGPQDKEEIEELSDRQLDGTHFSSKDIQLYLRALGLRKSEASVQGASGSRSEKFGIDDAISALNSYNFKTSFGKTKIQKWEQSWLPILVFSNDGSAQVLLSFEYGVSVKVLTNKVNALLPLTNILKIDVIYCTIYNGLTTAINIITIINTVGTSFQIR